MTARIFLGFAVLACASAAAAVETPLPASLPDVAGPRALALSASIGVATGNEGLFVNPATVAPRRRYSFETGGFVDRRGAETTGRFYGGSVVDSLSAPVAGGVAFLRQDEGAYAGNAWVGALAGPIAQGLYLGVSGKYLSFEGPESTSAATVDAGLFWQVADGFSLGAVGYNLVNVGDAAIAPMAAGAGLAVGSDRSLQLTADWRTDLDRREKSTNRYAVGAEVLLGQAVPVRAGWMKDETLGGSWWSLGAGIITRGGVAIDFGYRQSLQDPQARALALTLKVFLLQ